MQLGEVIRVDGSGFLPSGKRRKRRHFTWLFRQWALLKPWVLQSLQGGQDAVHGVACDAHLCCSYAFSRIQAQQSQQQVSEREGEKRANAFDRNCRKRLCLPATVA